MTVGPERIDAVVRVSDPAFLRTSAYPGVAARALRLFPGLVRHRCDCGSAHGITAELADTETPHLLEHLTLELAALAGSPRSLRGETTWDFERDGHGVFHVAIEYDDDLVLVGALSAAVDVVDALLGLADGPDLDSIVERLGATRTK